MCRGQGQGSWWAPSLGKQVSISATLWDSPLGLMGCMVEKCLRTLAQGQQAEHQTTVGLLPGKKLPVPSANAGLLSASILGLCRAKLIPRHV